MYLFTTYNKLPNKKSGDAFGFFISLFQFYHYGGLNFYQAGLTRLGCIARFTVW